MKDATPGVYTVNVWVNTIVVLNTWPLQRHGHSRPGHRRPGGGLAARPHGRRARRAGSGRSRPHRRPGDRQGRDGREHRLGHRQDASRLRRLRLPAGRRSPPATAASRRRSRSTTCSTSGLDPGDGLPTTEALQRPRDARGRDHPRQRVHGAEGRGRDVGPAPPGRAADRHRAGGRARQHQERRHAVGRAQHLRPRLGCRARAGARHPRRQQLLGLPGRLRLRQRRPHRARAEGALRRGCARGLRGRQRRRHRGRRRLLRQLAEPLCPVGRQLRRRDAHPELRLEPRLERRAAARPAATWTPESEPVDGLRRPDIAAPGTSVWSTRSLTGGAATIAPRVRHRRRSGRAGSRTAPAVTSRPRGPACRRRTSRARLR